MGKYIKLHWSGASAGLVNFGDTISPLIVEAISGKAVRYASIDSCDLLAIGSILDKASKRLWRRRLRFNFQPVKVWGSGSMYGQNLSQDMVFGAVRGPLTQQKLKLPENIPLGDPGLLVPKLLRTSHRKKYRWGIVPHINDRQLPIVGEMLRQTPSARVINLGSPDLLDTLADMAACDFIISSSLHGLVTADALGIPNIWMDISQNVKGGGFKFRDYFASVERETAATTSPPVNLTVLEKGLSCASQRIITQRQTDLETAWQQLDL